MLYPIFSYSDGTEVTASRPDEDGNVDIYVERFDKNRDAFNYARIRIPNPVLVSSKGYTEADITMMLERYSAIQEDIIDYVTDKGKGSA